MRNLILFVILSLVIVAQHFSHALFGNGKQERRRRLQEAGGRPESSSSWDMDASTGTVRRILTEEEEAAEMAAKTCDGQLAQSLVMANDEMLKARSQRDEAIKAKEEALARSALLERQLEETKASFTSKIQQLEGQLSSWEQDATQKVDELMKDAKLRLAEVEKEKQSEVDKLRAAAEHLRAEKDAQIQELQKQMADQQDKLREEYSRQIQGYEEEKQRMVEESKKKIDSLASETTAKYQALLASSKKAEEEWKQEKQQLAAKSQRAIDESKVKDRALKEANKVRKLFKVFFVQKQCSFLTKFLSSGAGALAKFVFQSVLLQHHPHQRRRCSCCVGCDGKSNRETSGLERSGLGVDSPSWKGSHEVRKDWIRQVIEVG